ncbi:MAG: hypothetical protein GAK31_01700 [Stenotrophomonas maltophilia]|uniref:Uncharacterized protein n=1 Tax=Stenotrophomonas maltophilia TaxID=40324 RepID=A0A7V8JMN6_STEMA|nr:MAG: hypothetical protein GAK31_01700 [Stenotrophomonas maltophilia]
MEAKEIAELRGKVRALEVLVEQIISTIPPEKRNGLYHQAKQSLLLHPQAVEATTAIEAIRMRAP